MPISPSKYLEMTPTLEAFKYSMLTQRAEHMSLYPNTISQFCYKCH